MASQAAARTPQAGQGLRGGAKGRVMRIGIVQGGRIIEERLIRSRENISLGWSSKAFVRWETSYRMSRGDMTISVR